MTHNENQNHQPSLKYGPNDGYGQKSYSQILTKFYNCDNFGNRIDDFDEARAPNRILLDAFGTKSLMIRCHKNYRTKRDFDKNDGHDQK